MRNKIIIFISCIIVIIVGMVIKNQHDAITILQDKNQLLDETINGQIQELQELRKSKQSLNATVYFLQQQNQMLEDNLAEINNSGVVEIIDDDTETENIETKEQEDEEITFTKTIGQDVILPNLPTKRKVITHYEVYNIAGTPHKRMQQLAWTDELGCRRYNNYYIVALGSAYADCLGETFEVKLDTGVTFTIITGDMKADVHTDPTNRYASILGYDGVANANVLEFIVDKNVLAKKAYEWGGVDYYDQFKGNIIRMTYLGRDTSADWDTYY